MVSEEDADTSARWPSAIYSLLDLGHCIVTVRFWIENLLKGDPDARMAEHRQGEAGIRELVA